MEAEADRPFRVLAIAEDLRGLVTACRVHAPLHTLRRRGVVEDFLVTDSLLTGLDPAFRFDVLWVQRAPEPGLAGEIVARFAGRYLHDMDDLLITEPGYIRAGEFPDRESLLQVIANAGVFTAPSERLVHLVEQRSGLSLAERSMVCPNAVEFPNQPPRSPQRPTGLVLTQSHRMALTESRAAVLGAVRSFAEHHGLPVYFFGPPLPVLGEGVEELLGPVVPCGYLDFWRYHTVLATMPTLIGVAPLETAGSDATNAFVAAKSDVKMVEYGGFGHPAVYSAAAPYVESDLTAGRLVENTGSAWMAGLKSLLEDDWRRAVVEQAAIVASRSMDRVATERWSIALDRARLPETVEAGVLPRPRSLLRGAWRRRRG